ncbi:MAG: hypothetical protein HC881_17460 [Leptolyngbyaceae cyanobacterium SL_7_1]|nr:hypothetical protein [Leptolyngbyaceae cyanobacterium SL_7_1]
MQIVDLSYLEDISQTTAICGGVLVEVDAIASTTGDSGFTYTSTITKARELKSGGAIAKGRGIAIAQGDNPMALVSVYGEGDEVFGKTKTKYFKKRDLTVSRGRIIAIDYP